MDTQLESGRLCQYQLPATFLSSQHFNDFCRSAIRKGAIKEGAVSEAFKLHRQTISSAEASDANVIKTAWGGVVITYRHDPQVQKFLVVDSGKWLAFEKHELKVETLAVREGLGLLIYRPEGNEDLRALDLKPGVTLTLQPGQEHCIISFNNLLVHEQSMDYKGMDKDLIFIHLPVY